MVLDQEWAQNQVENYQQEEEQKVVKDFLPKKLMIKLESLKKKEHFLLVLKNRIINNDFFSIYCKKNFIHNKKKNKLYISFVIKKKIGNAVKRNRIKRKLRSIVQKLTKINGAINLNYTYIVFGKTKSYKENHISLYERMEQSFKKIKN